MTMTDLAVVNETTTTPTASGHLSTLSVEEKRRLLAELLQSKVAKPQQYLPSWAQERLWFLHQLDGNSANYNMLTALRVKGPLQVAALHRSLNEIARRHAVLRTHFQRDANGAPVAIVAPALDLALTILELPGADEATIKDFLTAEIDTPFDLTAGPLLRVHLLQLAPEEHILVWAIHHIIFDGYSIGVWLQELASLYNAFVQDVPSPLAELPLQYYEYARQQREQLQGTRLQQLLTYWKTTLAGAPPLLELPTDHPRPAIQTQRGQIHHFSLDYDLTQALKQLSVKARVTLFATLQAAFVVLLARYSRQDDIVIGTVVANRNRTELEALLGFLVNTLALRHQVADDPSFLTLLQRVQQTTRQALAHQDLPFEQLVNILQPERNLSHAPIMQIVFSFMPKGGWTDSAFTGLSITPIRWNRSTAKFDLTLLMREATDELGGGWEYNIDLFDPATIARMAGHFEVLLEAIVAHPEQPIHTLPLLSAPEQQQLQAWNATETDYPQDQTLVDLFERQVEETPDNPAVVFEDQRLTYAELNAQANQLAHYLLSLQAPDHTPLIRPDTLVAICVERSLDMVVGLLGILKAGAAYVPLDPGYPAERIAFMLEDSAAPVLLTQTALKGQLPLAALGSACEMVYLDTLDGAAHPATNPARQSRPESLAYVIYTSGSTGRPKGVMIEHHNLFNFLWDMQQRTAITSADKLLAITTLSFDIAALEVYLPLITGSTLFLVSRETASDGIMLQHQLATQPATFMQATPATWQLLQQSGWQPHTLIKVLSGGEALTRDLAHYLLQNSKQLWNVYGPTETTVWSSAHDLTNHPEHPLSIGQPIANTRIYILDAHHHPLPPGLPGELCIAGAGLARGYLNRPELTAEKFIELELFGQPERLYQTGDLARWLPDGNLEYLGRLDHQVKLRGFRIECGEVEAALLSHPDVAQAVVVAREEAPGERRLVAYLVATGEAPTATELRAHLRRSLPEFMVPQAFVFLAALPLTPNGKVDRQALPASERGGAEKGYVAPRVPTDEILAGIWAEVLGLERVGVYDHFFELGGHSLLAVQVLAVLREALQVDLSLTIFFERDTIAALADHIDALKRVQDSALTDDQMISPLPQVRPDPSHRHHSFPLTDIQQAYWMGRDAAFALSTPTHRYAEIEAEGLDADRLGQAWQRLIERHEMLRAVILPSGEQQILAHTTPYEIKVYDLIGADADRIPTHVEAVRERMWDRQSPPDQWPLFDIRFTRLEAQRMLIHISLDILIADGHSYEILFREWYQLYHNPDQALPPLDLSFRDYVLTEKLLETTALYQQAQAYWLNRLETLPAGPDLPLTQDPATLTAPQFKRYETRLTPAQWQPVKQQANQLGLTPTAVLLAAYAEVLAQWSRRPQFTPQSDPV